MYIFTSTISAFCSKHVNQTSRRMSVLIDLHCDGSVLLTMWWRRSSLSTRWSDSYPTGTPTWTYSCLHCPFSIKLMVPPRCSEENWTKNCPSAQIVEWIKIIFSLGAFCLRLNRNSLACVPTFTRNYHKQRTIFCCFSITKLLILANHTKPAWSLSQADIFGAYRPQL